MDKNTLSRINMIGAVSDFSMSEKAGPFRELLHYEDVTGELVDLNNQITEAQVHEAQETTGPAAQKALFEEELIDIAGNVVKKLVAYATFNDNTSLMKEIGYSVSELRKSPDRVLVSRCSNILEKVRGHADALTAYRLVPEMISGLETAIGNFDNSLNTVRLEKTANTAVRHDLKDLVKQAISLIDSKLDRIIDTVRDEYPSLCEEYDQVRKIVDL